MKSLFVYIGMGLLASSLFAISLEAHVRVMPQKRLYTINPAALAMALQEYADKYPESYPNHTELAQRIEAFTQRYHVVQSQNGDLSELAETFRQLQADVLLKHPAIDFDELLFVKRRVGTPQGLFVHWQGNSGTFGNQNGFLTGYDNALVRVPIFQKNDTPVKTLRQSSTFIGDLCLDWDAKRLIFSSGEERSDSVWRLFEMDVDGSNYREAYADTDRAVDYYDPCYLPDGRIIAAASTGFQGVPCIDGNDYVANLHLIDKERKGIRRLTFEQDMNWYPEVYPNGRVIYLRWEYTDTAHYFSRILMTMNPDGSDQKELYGSNSYWPNAIFYHQHIPGSSTKFVGIVTGHHGVNRKGELVMFDVSKGRHETSGAVHKFPFRGKKIENITLDALVDNIKPYFLHPQALNDELFLVSIADDNEANFRVALVDVYDNVLTLWEDEGANLYEPIPLKSRPTPAIQPDRVDVTSKTATIYMTDVMIGQDTLKDVPPGSVKKMRVFHYEYSLRNIGGHALIGIEGPWDVRILHGTVDVEEDGSCMFIAPANTPISVQPLDKDGNALTLMRSWMTAMPGEKLSCIGCHENQSLAPPMKSTIAARKVPQEIKPWNGAKRGFSFDREVQPVLDRKCVACHQGLPDAKNAMGQPLPNLKYGIGERGFSRSYLDLHPYVRRNGPEGDYHVLNPLEFHVSTSDLFQTLEKGHHGVVLTDEEKNRLATWIDLNVPYFGTWTERGANKTMIDKRRYYERTICGITFDPEKILNPYTPGTIAFEMPKALSARTPALTMSGWPFDGAIKQGDREYQTLSFGTGQAIKAVKIPAGTFVMGANNETSAEQPMHSVTIDKPFYMGVTEVSYEQWLAFDPTYPIQVLDMHHKDQVNRGYFMDNPKFPVFRISWNQAQAFCAWLSQKTGKKVRLPTEAEWEYACRAGTDTAMNYGDVNVDFSRRENLADVSMKRLAVWGIDPQPIRNPPAILDYEKKDARFNDGYLHLAPVGSYAPNAFGLYDMHGNIAEWTSSVYAPYPFNPIATGDQRVLRGGSWYQRQIRATSSWRVYYPQWQHVYNAGFRVVIEE